MNFAATEEKWKRWREREDKKRKNNIPRRYRKEKKSGIKREENIMPCTVKDEEEEINRYRKIDKKVYKGKAKGKYNW